MSRSSLNTFSLGIVCFALLILCASCDPMCILHPTRTPAVPDPALKEPYCPWYNGQSVCCIASDFPDTPPDPNPEGCKEIPQGCMDVNMLMMCGVECKPMEPPTNGVRICKDFADRYYASCKDAEMKKNGECVTFGSQYPDVKDYFKAPAFNYVEDNTNCFNAASAIQNSIGLLMMMMMAALFGVLLI